MKIKKSFGSIVFDSFNTLVMLFMIVICLYPFWYVVVCSFSDGGYLIGDTGVMLWPKGFNLKAYDKVLNNPSIFSGYKTTLTVLVTGVLLNLIMTSLGAFVVTRKKFKPAKTMMKLMIFTMYFSGGLIPSYLLIVNGLHLQNTLLALILPSAISTHNLIIMKTNFAAIPDSLEESACIDGANDWTIFWKIILPLSKPVLAVMVLYYGVGHWNSWFNAMLYLEDKSKYPLQLVLREILLIGSMTDMGISSGEDSYTISESIKYATIIVATLPILAVYPFIQKYFVKGVMIGAVKG